MSGATYRIEITHDPHSKLLAWDARVFTVAGDYCRLLSGSTPDEAEAEAREWIDAQTRKAPSGRVVFVDDEGNDAEAPQSVKV